MIKINLLPVPKVRKQRPLIMQAVAGLIVIGLVSMACYFVGLQKKEAISEAQLRNTTLQRKIDELRAQVGEVEKFKKQVQALEEQLGVIRALEKGRSGPVKMMDELTELLPRRLWVTSFKESQKKVQVEGLAESGMVIADFLDALKASRFFQSPTLLSVTSQEMEGNTVHRFQVTMQVKYDL